MNEIVRGGDERVLAGRLDLRSAEASAVEVEGISATRTLDHG